MLLYFKIYFNNIEVISYSNIGPISTRPLRLSFCVKLVTSLCHQYLVLQHPLTLTLTLTKLI